ncbi:MAG: HAD family hydrolase [Brevefilum sp.]
MIKAIVLDIGGVVLRTEDKTGRRVLEQTYGLLPGGVDALVFKSQAAAESTLGKTSLENIWQHVANELSLSNDELIAFQRAFWQGDQIDQNLVQFLQTLRTRYTTAFLTNAWVNARDALETQYCIVEGETVDHLLISSELGVAKPDPKIYDILSETINARFEQIIFVDDFIENIEAASALGLHTIHYQPGMDLIAHIQNRLDQYESRLEEKP